MSKFASTEKYDPALARYTMGAEPITISQDQARQGPLGTRVAYLLGFGIAGAVLANALVFIYFASVVASG
jgi:hypothetical protein